MARRRGTRGGGKGKSKLPPLAASPVPTCTTHRDSGIASRGEEGQQQPSRNTKQSTLTSLTTAPLRARTAHDPDTPRQERQHADPATAATEPACRLPPPPPYLSACSKSNPRSQHISNRHPSYIPSHRTQRGKPSGAGLRTPPLRVAPFPPPPAWLPVGAFPSSPGAAAYAFSEEGLSRELLDFSAYVALSPAEHEQRAMLIHAVAACAADLWPTREEVKQRQPHTQGGDSSNNSNNSSDANPSECPRHHQQQQQQQQQRQEPVPFATTGGCPRRRIVAQRDLVVYGSYALGLSLPSSDVDMCVALGLPPLQHHSLGSSSLPSQASPSVDGGGESQSTPENSKREGQGTSEATPSPAASRESSCGSTTSPYTIATAPDAALLRQQRQLEALYDLADHFLLCHGAWLRLEVHDQCRVPVIKLHDCRTGVSADVSVSIRLPLPAEGNEGGHGAESQGLRFRSLPVEDAVRRQRAWLWPPSSPSSPSACVAESQAFTVLATMLIMTTKAALRQWGLNNLFTGGASSTALYSLVHRYLGTRRRRREVDTARRQKERKKSIVPMMASMMSVSAFAHPHAAAEREKTAPEAGGEWSPSLSSPTASYTAPGMSEDDDSQTTISTTPTTTCAATTTTSVGKAREEESHLTARSTPVAFTATDDEDDEEELAGECQDEGEEGTKDGSQHPSRPSPSAMADGALSAAQLSANCVALFGVSPARLLLNLWRYLSADVFLCGYNIVDAFASDNPTDNGSDGGTLAAQCGSSYVEEAAAVPHATHAAVVTTGETADPSSPLPSPLAPTREATPPWLHDLTAPSFRLPELLALFRCASTQLENELAASDAVHQPPLTALMAMRRKGSRAAAASPLSLVLVDPRSLVNAAY